MTPADPAALLHPDHPASFAPGHRRHTVRPVATRTLPPTQDGPGDIDFFDALDGFA